MNNRGRARLPGFYSVNAIDSTAWYNPPQAWSKTTLLQHEIGHNFGCYKSTTVGHDEDQAHHSSYSTTSCVMHYVTQKVTDSFCSHCDETVADGIEGNN